MLDIESSALDRIHEDGAQIDGSCAPKRALSAAWSDANAPRQRQMSTGAAARQIR